MSTEPSLQGIAEKIDSLVVEVTKTNERIDQLSHDLSETNTKLAETNTRLDRNDERFEVYQKATQWVVQLAFGLIASATVTVLVTSVIRR